MTTRNCMSRKREREREKEKGKKKEKGKAKKENHHKIAIVNTTYQICTSSCFPLQFSIFFTGISIFAVLLCRMSL